MNKNSRIILVILGIILIIVIGAFLFMTKQQSGQKIAPAGVACTMEAKLCPDGSYVGRSGSACEFMACPGAAYDTNGWKTFSDSTKGITFKYPDTIPTSYIYTTDWPPKLQVTSSPFVCTEAGEETATAGKTTRQTIAGRDYCVTKESEGAAGSTYTQYAYATSIASKTVYLTFSLRFAQCGNYDDPEKTACESERASFSIDPLIDQIIRTVSLK